jgi:DNA helicase HerA-like ATPase
MRRNLTPDHVVRIGYDEIEPGDVQLLRETMNLSEVAASATYSLERKWGRQWFDTFTRLENADSVYELEVSDQPQALRALYNRLRTIRDRFPFLVSQNQSSNSVEKILEFLDKGKHVVLEFGRYGSDLSAYMLVVNLLTRRIHERYMVKKEQAVGDRSQEPRPLVIVIEEAHKFLNPTLASQTIFGTIAREDRKFNVTLLVIDQRPSAIDTEVMSQIGTKITCLMDNERDVEAVLSGTSGHKELKGVLSKLESKQQALIFGDAVPVPVVVQVREYGSPESYKQLGTRIPKGSAHIDKPKDPEDELFG